MRGFRSLGLYPKACLNSALFRLMLDSRACSKGDSCWSQTRAKSVPPRTTADKPSRVCTCVRFVTMHGQSGDLTLHNGKIRDKKNNVSLHDIFRQAILK